jgi:hypothetical protein
LQLKLLDTLSKVNHVSCGGLEGCCHSVDCGGYAILGRRSQHRGFLVSDGKILVCLQ